MISEKSTNVDGESASWDTDMEGHGCGMMNQHEFGTGALSERGLSPEMYPEFLPE